MNIKTLCLAVSVGALAAGGFAAQAVAQAPAKTGAAYHAPKNAWGQPNLQGAWTNATITPFERDAKLGDRLALSDKEVKDLEGSNAALVAEGNKPTDPNAKVTDLPTNCGRGFTGVDCGYNSAWVDPGTRIIDMEGVKRSSILVAPANGRLPAMTPAAAERLKTRMAAEVRGSALRQLRQSGEPLAGRALHPVLRLIRNGPPMLHRCSTTTTTRSCRPRTRSPSRSRWFTTYATSIWPAGTRRPT